MIYDTGMSAQIVGRHGQWLHPLSIAANMERVASLATQQVRHHTLARPLYEEAVIPFGHVHFHRFDT